MNENNVAPMLQHFPDSRLQEIIDNCANGIREQQDLLHQTLAEVARRRLGVKRDTAEDIA